jgi:hypothetical protein
VKESMERNAAEALQLASQQRECYETYSGDECSNPRGGQETEGCVSRERRDVSKGRSSERRCFEAQGFIFSLLAASGFPSRTKRQAVAGQPARRQRLRPMDRSLSSRESRVSWLNDGRRPCALDPEPVHFWPARLVRNTVLLWPSAQLCMSSRKATRVLGRHAGSYCFAYALKGVSSARGRRPRVFSFPF